MMIRDRRRRLSSRPSARGQAAWMRSLLCVLMGLLLAFGWSVVAGGAAPPDGAQPDPLRPEDRGAEPGGSRSPRFPEDEDAEPSKNPSELSQQGRRAAIEDLLKEALSQARQLRSEDLAASWRRQASQLDHRGYSRAARERREAARLCERNRPATVQEVLRLLEQVQDKPEQRRLAEQAAELDRQADALTQRGQDAGARKLLGQALEIHEALYPESRFPKGHLFLAHSLSTFGKLLADQGEHDRGLAHLERSLAMLEKLYPEGHSFSARTLNDLGRLLRNSGDYPKALDYLQRALTMCEGLYPPREYPKGHRDLAHTLDSLGDLLRAQGDFPKADSYSQRGLAMCEALYAKDQYPKGHLQLAESLSNMSLLLASQGEYEKALHHLQRGLAMCEALYPRDRYPSGHPQLAVSLRNMGTSHAARGEHQKARQYLQCALDMCEALYPLREYPRGHPLLVETLDALAVLVRRQEGPEHALPYQRRALVASEALYPRDRYARGHPRLAGSLGNMGASLAAQGDYGQALPYLEQALVMNETLYSTDRYPKGHPQLGQSLTYLGNALFLSGEHERGLPYLQRALAAHEALYPREEYPRGHPQLSFSLRSLGMLLHSRKEYQEAIPYLKAAVAMDQDLTETYVAAASEAEALNFAATIPAARDVLLSTPDQPNLSADDLYAPVWRGKAAIARILQRRQQARADEAGPASQQLWQELLDTRRKLSCLLLAPAEKSRDHLGQLRKLTARKEELERQLAQSLPRFIGQQLLELPPHRELVEKLPPGTVFIDLLRYVRIEPGPLALSPAQRRSTASYVAFVLGRGQSVRRVDLGPANPIDTALGEWRRDIVDQKHSAPADVLSRLLWEPLARHIPVDTRAVLLAPDGDLARLPWAALPARPGGRVLLEEYAVAVVPHGPFLLDRLTAPPPENEAGLLLAVGGVRYDTGPAPAARREREFVPLRAAERGGKERLWRYLPGTVQEVNKVIELGGARPTRALRGAEASTERLLAELPGARWAHLATHGFFADPDFRSVLQVDERLYERAHFGAERAAPGTRNPLVLSGLVLCGADRMPEESEEPSAADGILTAEALASLPLQDLELVVLSACDTGLGEVAGGEGVFGLQRAFHLAGAHTVVASLWKVDDTATQALMEEFYRNLWQRKLGKLEALRQAQLVMLRSYDARSGQVRGPGSEKPIAPSQEAQAQPEKSTQPFFWAAWVVSGDPGDLSQAGTLPAPGTADAPASEEAVPKPESPSVFWYLSVGGALAGLALMLALLVWHRHRHARQNSP